MSSYNQDSEFVNEEIAQDEKESTGSDWNRADFLLTVSGKYVDGLEFLQGGVWYGGNREPNEKPLGRASKDVTPEQQALNEQKVWKRNQRDLRQTVNANEACLTSFDTVTTAHVERNVDWFLNELDKYRKRVTRAVRDHFQQPGFQYLYAGTYGLQDGKRLKNKTGRMSLHAHEVNNLPFWKVKVIMGKVSNPDDPGAPPKEHYLLQDGTWSLVATQDTLNFPEVKRANKFLQTERQTLLQNPLVEKVWAKNLPYYTILWGRGHCWRDWFESKKEQDHIKDFGEYLAGNYLCENLDKEVEAGKLTEEEAAQYQQQIQGRKRWFHSEFETTVDVLVKRPGGLKRPVKLRGREAKEWAEQHGLWDSLVKVRSVKPEPDEATGYALGWLVIYRFNLWAQEKDWIETLPLGNRPALKLDPEISDYVTAYDLESWRREVAAREPVAMYQLTKAPPTLQEEMWYLPERAYG